MDLQTFFTIIHVFALVLCLGGATYSDILLGRFIKDFKICNKEAEVITTMSNVILVGIVIATLSGLGLLYLKPELLTSTKFLAKMIAFVVVVINGFALHKLILPKLVTIDFCNKRYIYTKLLHLRQLGAIFGAISFTSWYIIFILGSLKSIPISLTTFILGYIAVLIIASSVALAVEKYVESKHHQIK